MLTSGFGHNKTLSDFVLRCRELKEMLRKIFVTCSLVRLKDIEQIHLGIGALLNKLLKKELAYAWLVLKKLLIRLTCVSARKCKNRVCR